MENDNVVRVYRYGLLPPTRGADVVDEQIKLAHRYQNALIELERSRRQGVLAALARGEGIETLEAAVKSAERDLAAFLDAIKTIEAPFRPTRWREISREKREQGATLRQRLRQARAAAKEARQSLRDDPEVQELLAANNQEHRNRARAERAACGVYWGTYLLVEQAMDASRQSPTGPRFRRWTGEGAVGVQLQWGGISPMQLVTCEDRRVRLDLRKTAVPGRSGKPRPCLWLRVDSNENHDPVWAEWPVIYHRPLPEGCCIKMVKVVRRRIETHEEWSAHFTVEMPKPPSSLGPGVVAVDLGWRRQQGTIRAGGWTDGEVGGDILLDCSVLGELDKVASLHSIRDRGVNDIRAALLEWRDKVETLAADHAEQLRYLPQWRAPGRFARLALWWREHRCAGDETILQLLEAWRKQDKHLWLWEARARRGALARRREQYRVFAAKLAEQYGTLVVERLDLRALAEIPEPDMERESNPRARAQRHAAAPSELRATMVHAFQRRGRRVVTVDPGGPADTLLGAYQERRGDRELPGPARMSRFKRRRPENVGNG